MDENVERLVARYEDARGKLRREVESAIRTLEEAKARLQAGEVPTPLHMPPESLWATTARRGPWPTPSRWSTGDEDGRPP